MEIENDSTKRQVLKEAFRSVRKGNTDILEDLFHKLKENLFISFFSGKKCLCASEMEMVARKSSIDRYTQEQMMDIIESGMCPHTTVSAEDKQLVSISLLHFACFFGQKEIVKWLIDHGANVCAGTSPSGYTPLQTTICSRNADHIIFDIMCLLINNGANPSQRDPISDEKMLHVAVRKNRLCAVELLLQNHCDIDAVCAMPMGYFQKYEQTALYVAVSLKRLAIVKVLVNHNADVNKAHMGYSTPMCLPLLAAVHTGEYEIVKALLETPLGNLDINRQGYTFVSYEISTALHYAVRQGHRDIVTLLWTHGADINTLDSKHNTPLITAMIHKRIHIFRDLIRFGADLNYCDPDGAPITRWLTPIHRAACLDKEEYLDILLEHGCDYDRRDCNGMTPLAIALDKCHMSIALKLMNLNVNLNNSDLNTKTLFHYYHSTYYMKICKRLVELGADPNAVTRFNVTPLWNAVYQSNRSVVKFLLQLNVYMSVAAIEPPQCYYDDACKDQFTPLLVAFRDCDDPYIAAMLIIAGVNISEEKWLRSTDLEVFNKSPGSAPHVDLLRSYTESPVSLKRLCRDEIRRRLATRLADALPLYDLPASLTDYVLIKHDLELCEAGTLDLLTYKF